VSRAQRQGDSDDEFTEIKYEPAVGTRIESKTRISSGRGILLRSEEKKSLLFFEDYLVYFSLK
jgi:hypothetical protein